MQLSRARDVLPTLRRRMRGARFVCGDRFIRLCLRTISPLSMYANRPAVETPTSEGLSFWPTMGSARTLVALSGVVTLALGIVLALSSLWAGSAFASKVLLVVGTILVIEALFGPSEAANPSSGADLTLAQRHARYEASLAAEPGPDLESDYQEGSEMGWTPEAPVQEIAAWVAGTTVPGSGDELWHRWGSTAGQLPVELVGPVPETAYIPPHPGEPVLYEEGEPVAIEALLANGPASWIATPEIACAPPESMIPHPAPPEPAPRPLGPIIPTPAIPTVTNLPEPIASTPVIPTVPVPLEAVPKPPSAPAPSPPELDMAVFLSIATTPVAREALDPTPPHLRPEPAHVTDHRPVRSDHTRHHTGSSTRCADCHKVVQNPKVWSRCSDCHSQLCSHCIVDALLAYEWAWCTHCAGLRNIDSLAERLAPPHRTSRVRRSAPGLTGPKGPLSVRAGPLSPARWN